MSLNIIAVDKYNSNTIKTIEDNKNLNILIDDSLKVIKEKLALSNDYNNLPYIPSFTKIEIKDLDNNYITIKKSLFYTISSIYDNLPNQTTIYITHIEDELKNFLHENIGNLFYKITNDFPDLIEDDFNIIYNNIINPDLIENENFYNKIISIITDIKNKYKEQIEDVYLNAFYKESEKYTYKDIGLEPTAIQFTNLDITIKNKDKVIESQKIPFIKLEKLFNILELDNEIPFIALNKRFTNNKMPLIKTYNSILQNVQSKEVKNWVLTEKLKLNQVNYKKIVGILLKVKMQINKQTMPIYITLNILPTGIIFVNIKLQKNTFTLNEILDNLKISINNVILKLNTLDVFTQSKHLSTIDNSIISIKSISNTIVTNFFINREKFKDILNNKYLSSNLLELKKTESLIILSAFYKNTYKSENLDIKGLTINIEDNPYNLESSIINISGAENLLQTQIITMIIFILNILSNDFKIDKVGRFIKKKGVNRKVKEITNKKKLKDVGYNFDSKKCQPPRQPVIVDENTPLNENIITFKTWKFKCADLSSPYPGFLNNNIPCCFANNRVGSEVYIRNKDPESLNISVRPSNLKIKIKIDGIKKLTEVLVIKLTDDDDDDNYYYISEDNRPTLINDKDAIKKIKAIINEKNIWLPTVKLAQVIYPATTNKCINAPILNKRLSSIGKNTLIDLKKGVNAPCEFHEKTNFFGFSSNSIPCCYNSERSVESPINKRELDIAKGYISTTYDKLLDFQKFGILQPDLDSLFNKTLHAIPIENSKYYRMGIIQGSNSILNCILLGINNTLNGSLKINGISDFKQIITHYLNNNKSEFNRLNNGQIFIKYNSIDNYLNYINNKSSIYWGDIIDLLEQIINLNVLIIDINDKTKILCRPGHVYNNNKPFLILLKKKLMDNINIISIDTFELVIKLETIDKKKNLIKQFDSNNKIVNFLVNYYTNSCVKEYIYPDNYKYKKLYTINSVKEIVNNQNLGDIKYQLEYKGRTSLLMTFKNILLPIQETGVTDDLEKISLNMLYSGKLKLLSLNDYIKYYKKLDIKILGITTSNKKNIGGLLTEFGYLIPFLEDKNTDKENITEIPKLNFIYYLDIDENLIGNNPKINLETENLKQYNIYNKHVDKMNNDLFKTKTIIAKRIEKLKNKDQVIEYIKEVITATNFTKLEKIDKIIVILLQLLKNAEISNYLLFLLKTISNEMILDNIENSLLNGIVVNQSKNNEIIKRETESILLNLDDIYKWIKTYQQN